MDSDFDSLFNSMEVDTGAAVGGVLALFLLLLLPILIVSVISVIATWKIFKKTGEEGWKAIIPIYNTITLFQIVNIKPILILIGLIPVVGGIGLIALGILAGIRLCRGFDKSDGFTVGYFLLNPVFGLILAFDNSTWDISRINMEELSFVNNEEKPAAKAKATKAEPKTADTKSKTTPEDPWVKGDKK